MKSMLHFSNKKVLSSNNPVCFGCATTWPLSVRGGYALKIKATQGNAAEQGCREFWKPGGQVAIWYVIICPLSLVEIGLFNHQNRGERRSPPLFRHPWAHISAVAFTLFGLVTPPVRLEFSNAGINAKNLKRPCANGIEKDRGRERSSAFFLISYS